MTPSHLLSFLRKDLTSFFWMICSDVTCVPISHGGDPCSIPDHVELMVDKVTGFSPNSLAALNRLPCRRNATVRLFCATSHFPGFAMTTKVPAVATLRPGRRPAIVTEFVARTSKSKFFITKKLYFFMCSSTCYALSCL